MRQSNVIFSVLLVAFVIYITIRDQLPEYLSLFTGDNTDTITNTENDQSNDATGDWRPLSEKLKIPETGDYLLKQFDNVFKKQSM